NDIVLSGPYIRMHVDEMELQELMANIEAVRGVKQAIGVRVEGPPIEPRHVLVYGMRRWQAAQRLQLKQIPVRNYGRIGLAEALALQVMENEARKNPHPVETAVSYELLVREGKAQKEVAAIAGRSAAHVSYMRAAGEAILGLSDTERAELVRHEGAAVPLFQDIAPLPLAERTARLRALLALSPGRQGPPAAAQPATSRPPLTVHAGPTRRRGGWTFTVRYHDDEVRKDAELREQLRTFLEEQLKRLNDIHG
ncbi:MAG: ParB N-terminal domain-containing protein, partial [Gemmatimonadetes bacterium]|nr:ParB N-terminal domain-containing protein [Gemmatimonadota bacterium]